MRVTRSCSFQVCFRLYIIFSSGSGIVELLSKQECIPVGCVPPAAVAVPGGLHQAPSRDQAPHPGADTPLPGTRHPPCEQNDRQVQKYYLAPMFVCGR